MAPHRRELVGGIDLPMAAETDNMCDVSAHDNYVRCILELFAFSFSFGALPAGTSPRGVWPFSGCSLNSFIQRMYKRTESSRSNVSLPFPRSRFHLPYCMQLGSITTVPILSHSVLDYSTQMLTNTIENETMRDRVTIDEVCTFVVHPDNENWCVRCRLCGKCSGLCRCLDSDQML